MKKVIVLLALIAALFVPFCVSADDVNVMIEEIPVRFEGQGPAIVDGRTLVPVRGVFEMLGFDVSWSDETRTVTLSGGGYIIHIQIDSDTFIVNSETRVLDVPAQIINGRTMLPIRALIESIGFHVSWDAATSTVLISVHPFNVDAPARDTVESVVYDFFNGLIARDFERILPMMSDELQLLVGDFDSALFVLTESMLNFAITDSTIVDDVGVFEVTATHTMGIAVYTLIVSGGRITSFSLLMDNFTYVPAPVPANAVFTSTAVTIGTDWPLDGFLTMPNNATAENPVPAVILVHGSGAHNMDSSIFDNRPFWDIAEYLSSNGIAVIRYNKRTYTHGRRFRQVFGTAYTAWEETIEDALFAAELLRADERVSDVYVLGLSLGGKLAPYIAEAGGLDGAILLAGSPRLLYEVQYDQNIALINNALASAAGYTQSRAESDFMRIDALLAEAREIIQLPPEELANEVIFGLPALYHLSLANAVPLPIITANDRPTLILQGGRDWQVLPETDFRIFVENTEDLPYVTAILYENLNHLFLDSTTEYNDLRDYIPAGRVNQQVLSDIVEWILTR